jgi:hypothetical protein
MNKIFTSGLLALISLTVKAQTLAPPTQEYGKIDKADLEMKACDFEKDANAEVLFNKGDVYYNPSYSISMQIHKRIKIFNDNGKNEANIHIKFYGGNRSEYITGIQAETINLIDGKVTITKLDKNLIYTKNVDKVRTEITFSLPNVKSGSVIEYKYVWNTNAFYNMPDWYFQEKIPIRYSEISTDIPDILYFRAHLRVTSTMVKNTTGAGNSSSELSVRAVANVPSLTDEPYMSSEADNLQYVSFQLVTIKQEGEFIHSYSDTWAKVGGNLADDEDFGGQLKRKLAHEDTIITKAKALKTDDKKIAYVFNTVKAAMKWNGIDQWYTEEGTSKAWDSKIGNSTEVNLILYHLLKQSGIDAYPMVVSTREHGKVIPYLTSLRQFNRGVVYVKVDTSRYYVLDATGKYNTYYETPAELLNSSGLYIDKSKSIYNIINLAKDEPVRQSVLINAEIKPTGKIEGNAQISSASYNRIDEIERYKKDGEKKYIDYLRNDDNNMKISSIKFDNMEIDTLPLALNINFNLDLAGSDENYIYLNPNLFNSIKSNPFLSENRMTDIDFGYGRAYNISCIYKMPAGYKIDAMPKSISIVIPDKSVAFKRLVIEQDGAIMVRYTINYKNAVYKKADYPDLHAFVKKMYELLNEQIVLKKS